MHHRSHDQGGLCAGDFYPGGSLFRGVSVQLSLSGGVSVQGVSVWGSIQGGLCPGGLCLGGSLSRGWSLSIGVTVWGVSVLGSLCPTAVSVRETPRQRPPCTVTRGQDASYWNAFLFIICVM